MKPHLAALMMSFTLVRCLCAGEFAANAMHYAPVDEAVTPGSNGLIGTVDEEVDRQEAEEIFRPLETTQLFRTRQLTSPIPSVVSGDDAQVVAYEGPDLPIEDPSASSPISILPSPEVDAIPGLEMPPGSLLDEQFTQDEAIVSGVLGGEEFLQPLTPIAPPWVAMRNRTIRANRFGWWQVNRRGSPVKVGEYQSLEGAMFGDVDGLLTNGLRTLDYSHSFLDKDASQSYARYFGPLMSVEFYYDRYLRRLDRDPLDFFVDFDQQPPRPLPAPPANFRDMKEDLTVGDDFAIRVQELEASFEGNLSQNVKWRLNMWGMRKHGERQAIAMAHCFNAPNATDTNGNPVTGSACHMLSQSQRIDWLTAEIEPVVEYNSGSFNVEYSRTMRMLTTQDDLVTRPYDRFGFTGDQPYAVVPENTTTIDRLKLGVRLPDRRDAYARIYNGNTENEFRDTNRRFHGFDLRFTDRSISGLSLTTYAKKYVQTGQFPTVLLPFETLANVNLPINYDRTTAGLSTSWRPFEDEMSVRSRLVLSSGYEYRDIERENAIFQEDAFTANESATRTNQLKFRATMNWSEAFSTYSRYRLTFIDDPLYAVPIRNTTTNTNLPTQTHHVEFGSTWSPTYTFMLTGLFGVNSGWNNSEIANFEEQNYDLVFTAWYNPLPRWTFSGGLAFYSNWIDQDITLGSKSNPLTLPWEYGGRSDVVNFGTTFAWTDRLSLNGTIDFTRGRNAFDTLVQWPEISDVTDVNVETMRVAVGGDYVLGPRSAVYVRYQLFDYDDRSGTLDGGTAEMLLLGASAFY